MTRSVDSTRRSLPAPRTEPASGSTKAQSPDEVRAQVAKWAIQQANDPRVGYRNYTHRFGDKQESDGSRYFDCSGLCFSANKQFGVTLGGNWTGAMRQTAHQWSDQIPKDLKQMKPGEPRFGGRVARAWRRSDRRGGVCWAGRAGPDGSAAWRTCSSS